MLLIYIGGVFMIKNSDWIIMNSIIYRIYSTKNSNEMRFNLLSQLKDLFDYDSASFFMASQKHQRTLENPVGYHYPEEQLTEYIINQDELDYSEGITFTGENIVYRSSDLLPDKSRTALEYYRKIYYPNNWHFSIHINLSYNKKFIGTLSFFRKNGKEDFDYDTIYILDIIKEHLALRLYNENIEDVSFSVAIKQCAQNYNLSRREICVLKRLVTDKTIIEIADELVITINTLRKHISSIYKKMGISSRIQLFEKVSNHNSNE